MRFQPTAHGTRYWTRRRSPLLFGGFVHGLATKVEVAYMVFALVRRICMFGEATLQRTCWCKWSLVVAIVTMALEDDRPCI